MQMPGRKYMATSSSKYRYSINGQEKESELNENITTALYWEYDSRIVRRWNVDPVYKEYESPYLAFAGNPIWLKDLDGADTTKGKITTPSFKEFASKLKAEDEAIWDASVKKAAIFNKAQSQKPLFNTSAAITFGADLTLKGKVLGVGAGLEISQESRDLIGVRDNEGVFGGINTLGERNRRTGIGLNIAGFGGEIMVERDANKTTLDSKSLDYNKGDIKVTSKVTAPLNSWQQTRTYSAGGKKAASTTSSHSTPLINIKAAAFIGFEINIEMNTRSNIILVRPVNSDETHLPKPYIKK